MQAEHIPVHLGAMPSSVAAVLDEDHAPGDAWILNDPFRGGTHLPDITLITPVFAAGELVGFAANRAHHADVGGSMPGSMPADSTSLEQEGVVIGPTRLVREGVVDEELLADLTGRMRSPDQRRADLRAQLASARTGEGRLADLVGARAGPSTTVRRGHPGLRRAADARPDRRDGGRPARGRDVLEATDGRPRAWCWRQP